MVSRAAEMAAAAREAIELAFAGRPALAYPEGAKSIGEVECLDAFKSVDLHDLTPKALFLLRDCYAYLPVEWREAYVPAYLSLVLQLCTDPNAVYPREVWDRNIDDLMPPINLRFGSGGHRFSIAQCRALALFFEALLECGFSIQDVGDLAGAVEFWRAEAGDRN